MRVSQYSKIKLYNFADLLLEFSSISSYDGSTGFFVARSPSLAFFQRAIACATSFSSSEWNVMTMSIDSYTSSSKLFLFYFFLPLEMPVSIKLVGHVSKKVLKLSIS